MEDFITDLPLLTGKIELLYSEFTAFTKINPVVGGMAGMWLLGVLTYFFRTIPFKLIAFVKRYTTVTATLNDNHESFHDFLKWFVENNKNDKTRTIRVSNGKWGCGETQVSAGLGHHYFMHKLRPYKLVRRIISSDGGDKVKEELTLTTVGFSQRALKTLINDTIPKRKKIQRIYTWNTSEWSFLKELDGRPLTSVILKAGQKDRILNFIEEFSKEKDWYKKNGIPYKTGIILSGPPGTGKTSLIRAIGGHLGKHLCVINCGTVTESGFQKALELVPDNSIVLLEDFDSIESTHERIEGVEDKQSLFGVSLSGMLNAIDGVFSSKGRILIATTNHLDKIDKALTRPGRFDLQEELGYVDMDTTTRLFKKFYPAYRLKGLNLPERISPAQIENCVLLNKKDAKKAKIAIENLKQDCKK